MGQSFHLLRSAGDWDRYRKMTAAQFTLFEPQVAWGKGPTHYPCLVASYRVNPQKVISCYVYSEEAQKLLDCQKPLERRDPPVMPSPKAAHDDGDKPLPPSRSDFDRHVSAMLLAIVELLIETGIVKPEDFEKRLLYKKSVVDRWATEDKDEFTKQDNQVMRHLHPEI